MGDSTDFVKSRNLNHGDLMFLYVSILSKSADYYAVSVDFLLYFYSAENIFCY